MGRNDKPGNEEIMQNMGMTEVSLFYKAGSTR